MKLIKAFFQLIRWPNLVFIGLTQWLFYFCIVPSVYEPNQNAVKELNKVDGLFYLLIFSSIMIAAAGYIINDYFDLQIDAINKPKKVVIDKILKRRWAIVWHLLLSLAGLGCSIFISIETDKWIIAIANFSSIFLLWIYSTTFKKKILTGNIIISALTAWVVLVVYYFAGANFLNYKGWENINYPFDIRKLYQLTILYSGFAFIISLIREAVKDMEDMEGDARFQCNTMPIKWGIPASKVFVAVWVVICISSLIIIQIYAWQTGWWISAVYNLCFVIIPLLFVLKKLYKAKISADYHQLSNYLKLVMLAGILSMLFFKLI